MLTPNCLALIKGLLSFLTLKCVYCTTHYCTFIYNMVTSFNNSEMLRFLTLKCVNCTTQYFTSISNTIASLNITDILTLFSIINSLFLFSLLFILYYMYLNKSSSSHKKTFNLKQYFSFVFSNKLYLIIVIIIGISFSKILLYLFSFELSMIYGSLSYLFIKLPPIIYLKDKLRQGYFENGKIN